MSSQLTPSDIEKHKPLFLKLLPPSGASANNITVRPQLVERVKRDYGQSLSDGDYWAIRGALLADGKIRKARGVGGGVALVDIPPPITPEGGQYQKEQDLYAPLRETVEGPWAAYEEMHDFVCEVTAEGAFPKATGKWRNPDLAVFAIKTYPFLFGKFAELTTFEVKRSPKHGVEGVFETASHSAIAHRSYLLVYTPPGCPEMGVLERVEAESVRFEVGLVTFGDPADFSSFGLRVEPVHRTPDPADLCQFVQEQFSQESRDWIQTKLG